MKNEKYEMNPSASLWVKNEKWKPETKPQTPNPDCRQAGLNFKP